MDSSLLILILIVLIVFVLFKFSKNLNNKIDAKIQKDIITHFRGQGYKIIEIKEVLNNNDKNLPFNTNEWSFWGSEGGRDHYANKFWKATLEDEKNTQFIKYVNTGHFYLYKVYLIEKAPLNNS